MLYLVFKLEIVCVFWVLSIFVVGLGLGCIGKS